MLLGCVCGITNLNLVAHAIIEHGHLLNLLKTTMPDGLIRGMRSYQQYRRMDPVGCLDGRNIAFSMTRVSTFEMRVWDHEPQPGRTRNL